MSVLQPSPPVHRQVTVPVQIRSDVYPARVDFSFGENTYPRSRAIVTADEVVVLVEGGTQVLELYRAPLLDVTGTRTKVTAMTEDGTIEISKMEGCGCGGSLKAYRAFSNSVRMASPRR